MNNKILVTGAAGFIGFHLCERLLKEGYNIVGLDNINNYYDPDLKYARLKQLGIEKETINYNKLISSLNPHYNFEFIKLNLEDEANLISLFKKSSFTQVCNLAAQAGVRYSIENPHIYINSNINGFLNLLECMKKFKVPKLVYASSSSVYGANKKVPFSTKDRVDEPLSLYAATKKSNELMAHTYSNLYGIKAIGLRFFTVYGPWGRPDMAMFLFTNAILNDKPIKVFNNGNLSRDFTYIGDIVEGVSLAISSTAKLEKIHSIYNIGNGSPVKLLDFIEEIEHVSNKKAQKNFLPMQPGDVETTWADTTEFEKAFNFKPYISIKEGIRSYIAWYKSYY